MAGVTPRICLDCGVDKPYDEFWIAHPLPGGPEFWERCRDCRQKVWFASSLAYVLAHRCPACHAEPGNDCHSPGKRARQRRLAELLAHAGREFHEDPDVVRMGLQHASRQSAGGRHHNRDVMAAPWPEQRDPDRCYSTIDLAIGDAR